MRTSVAMSTLLCDFDHRFDGSTLIRCGIRGFTSDCVVGKFRNIASAAQHLVPLLHDAEYTRRYMLLTRTDAARGR